MRKDFTDITLVVDRSGSMANTRDDAEGGINSLIEGQAGEPGEAVLTLVQFDTEYELVHRGEPIGSVPHFHLEPRGMTALLDAVGRAIEETGARLAAMPEADRPGLVVFVIVTDGCENSSQEFTKKRIKTMIEQQTNRYSWKFTFIGANQDAFAEAHTLGIAAGGAAKYDEGCERGVYRATMGKIARMRAQSRRSEGIDNRFTDDERRQMKH